MILICLLSCYKFTAAVVDKERFCCNLSNSTTSKPIKLNDVAIRNRIQQKVLLRKLKTLFLNILV